MSELHNIARRIKLRHLLTGFLVVFGSLPLILSSTVFIVGNRQPLEFHERVNLTNRAEALSRELSDHIGTIRKQLHQLGAGLVTLPEVGAIGSGLRQRWLESYLTRSTANFEFSTRIVNLADGSQFGPTNLPPTLEAALDDAWRAVTAQKQPVFQFVLLAGTRRPAVVIAEPVFSDPPNQRLRFVLEGVAELPVQGVSQGQVFLIGAEGEVLWSEDADEETLVAVEESRLVEDHIKLRGSFIPVYEYTMRVGGKEQLMIGQLSPVADTGWGVLVHQPKSAAFQVIGTMVWTTIISAVVMVALALISAPFATRLISQPIQRLATTSKEIASGNFGQRVEARGLGMEITDLAKSFNLMSGHVQAYVDQLKRAAHINRDLFIGSIRAFLAAIEAKEPYTRGHSERVASYSRTIANRLRMPREFQERIWVAGLLHDVGKIGIEDRVLNKGDVLTDEEYEEMKRHAAIGAEIMSSIDQLKEMLPAIRWHHERWNGQGYPDGLVGENIPLIARIVAVADTFDAVTTQRVYQDPYTPEDAVENIIKRLSGTGFDPQVVEAFVTAFEAGEVRVMAQATKPQRPQAKVTAAIHT